MDEFKLISYPVIIENQRYPRNAMIFNLGMVFDCDSDTRCYEPVVRKLARILRTAEVRNRFLAAVLP